MSHEPIEIASPLGRVTFRTETDADRDFRYRLFRNSRQPEFALLLPPPAYEQVMRHQFHAQTVSYLADFPRARFDIIELGGQPIGRIVVDRPGDVVYIVDQALIPELRNKGIGTAIMRGLMEEARAAGVPVRLMAAHGDPAMRLYARLGFAATDAAVPMYTTLEWRPAAAEGATRC
jgi:ribosomal protein S18 acetylase RimI-like enzyme